MPIKKPHENRPADYTALRWILAVQDALRGSREQGEAGATYRGLLSEEHHLLVEKWAAGAGQT